jgi:hypothetical protein
MAVLIADVPGLRASEDASATLATLGLLTGVAIILAGVLRPGPLRRRWFAWTRSFLESAWKAVDTVCPHLRS